MWIRWVASIVLILGSLYIILLNLMMWFGKKGSLVPILGGWLGAVGINGLPMPALHRWFWVPLLLDLGSAFWLISSMWALIVKSRSSDGCCPSRKFDLPPETDEKSWPSTKE
jgi:hypothetical protein